MPPSGSSSRRGTPCDERGEYLPEASLRPPKWMRQTSRSSRGSSRVSTPSEQRYDEPALLPLAGRPDDIDEQALPRAPLARDSSGRIPSIASSHMLSVSGSDYDSVYQLWRNSGTPSMLSQADRHASYSSTNRSPSAIDMAMIEKYRAGGASDEAQLHKGAAGAKGPKDYRAVGLAKYGPGQDKQMSKRKKRWLIALGALVALCLLGVVLGVTLSQTVFKSNDSHPSSSGQRRPDHGGGSGNAGNNSVGTPAVDPKVLVATWGTNGSTIELEDGSSFTYTNNFGGHWASQPLNDTARPQNYTPPLNEEFDYANGRMLGVNIGGWLVTEPFISPALYEPYENDSRPAIDEFTLSQKYREEGGLTNLRVKMTEHYETFITERDFADIAAAGLNWVRIPIGFWALETYDNEPFLEGVSWTYLLKAIQWARKYGLRVNLDLHAVPGSQNGYNHSGRRQTINFLQGPMGVANGQRTLNIIRQITQYISQPEVRNVVPMFSVVNEPWVITIGADAARAWYGEVYTMMRNITGTGRGNGPYISIHDGFLPLNSWNGFLSGADRVAWDTHPYLCFEAQNTDPWDVQVMKPCQRFGPSTDNGRAQLGITMGGETSLAINDCGLFLNGVGEGHRYDGSYRGRDAGNFPRMGSCAVWDDWENYSAEMRNGLGRFALTAMDSLHNFFFWTWKIGDSLRTGKPTSPMWSYKLGLEQGWMPRNPMAQAPGACQSEAARLDAFTPTTTAWNGRYLKWQTGDAGSYSPNTAANPWPPQSMVSAGAPVSNLPRYTQTKTIERVPTPTFTQTAIVQGDTNPSPSIGNWYNDADSAPLYTAIAGCSYPPDQYDFGSWTPSGWPCSGGGSRARRDVAGGAVPNQRAGPTPLATPLP